MPGFKILNILFQNKLYFFVGGSFVAGRNDLNFSKQLLRYTERKRCKIICHHKPHIILMSELYDGKFTY